MSAQATAVAQRVSRTRIVSEIVVVQLVLLAAFAGLWFLWSVMHTVA